MTTASTGLAKALGRSASGEVIAIAEMSATDLLASATDEQKAELAAALTPTAAAADDMPPKKKDGCSEDGDEDEASAESEDGQQAAAAPLSTNASVHERVKAVAAAVATDETCKGKAGLALDLLADDEFAGLSASGIIKMLGKGSASEAEADPEAGARAEMKSALASQNNSGIEANGGTKQADQAGTAAVWDKAIARVFPK
jgi:hypothetical protein